MSLSLGSLIKKASGWGGGSLPAWWTVDSTPGAESVEFAGGVVIAPTYTTVIPLTVRSATGIGGSSEVLRLETTDAGFPSFLFEIDGAGNSEFRMFDENEEEFVKLRAGGVSSFIKPSDAAGLFGLWDAANNSIIELEGSGLLGFFGKTPRVAQQTLGATPTGAEIRAVLVAFGLVAA